MLMGERLAEDGVVNGRSAGESSEDEKLQAECLRYFRERPVFGKLLRGFGRNISLTAGLQGQ